MITLTRKEAKSIKILIMEKRLLNKWPCNYFGVKQAVESRVVESQVSIEYLTSNQVISDSCPIFQLFFSYTFPKEDVLFRSIWLCLKS